MNNNIAHRSEILRDSVAWWLAHTGLHEKDQDSLFTDAGQLIFDRLLLCEDDYDQVACDAMGWLSERAADYRQIENYALENGSGPRKARLILGDALCIKAHISWGEQPGGDYEKQQALEALHSVFNSLEDRGDHYPEPESLPVY